MKKLPEVSAGLMVSWDEDEERLEGVVQKLPRSFSSGGSGVSPRRVVEGSMAMVLLPSLKLFRGVEVFESFALPFGIIIIKSSSEDSSSLGLP